MQLTDGVHTLDPSAIIVLPDRQRSKGKDGQLDVRRLQASIAVRGQLTPILINERAELLFGERRLTACRNLGIPVRCCYAERLTLVEAKLVELAENLHREDISWQDRAKGLSEIHQLFCSADPEWTVSATAEEVNMSQGQVSENLLVWAEMANPRILVAGTLREAFNVIQRRDQRKAGLALQDLLDTPDVVELEIEGFAAREDSSDVPAGEAGGLPVPASMHDALHVPDDIREGLAKAPFILRRVVEPEGPQRPSPEATILQQSFLEWAPAYAGPKFNFIHCDFPYGQSQLAGPQGRGAEEGVYADTSEVYWNLMAAFCENLNRFMSVASHLMFWTSGDWENLTRTREYFAAHAPSLVFHRFPLVWVKTDNAGIASDPRRGPRHIYEVCLFASRSSRQIVQVKADAYWSPSDRGLHPSTKPEPMLREFMTMLVDEGTSMLDPTCGSGAALRAAESLGAKRVLGLEIDPKYVEPARAALKLARSKASAAAQPRLLDQL